MSGTQQNKVTKRKLWADESMINAVKSVQEGKGLGEASRLYNVPVETLRRRVTGAVDIACRPGPSTVLTEDEEDRLAIYVTKHEKTVLMCTKHTCSYFSNYLTFCICYK